jgi:copper transport protein
MHVLAMSVWLGGLLALASTVPAAAGELPVAERRSLWVGVVTRFSDVAVRAFPVLLGTGALQAIAYLPGPAAILSGAYGRMVGVKLLLACALLGVAWGNRRRSSAGRLAAPATAAAVRRAVVAELALAGAVLVVTASLVATAPPGVPMR